MGTVYRKTEKGQAEIATRQNHLALKLRSALIMVDGKRTDDELLRMIAPPAEEALQTLLAEGYIEVIGLTAARASSSARPAPEEGPSTLPPAPHKPVETLRQQAVRFMSEQLGPLGDNLAVKMEKAKSWEDLHPLLVMAHRYIADNRGAATADAFKAAFLE